MTRTTSSLLIIAIIAMSVFASHHEHHRLMQANWNVQGTVDLVKQFEGLSLTAYVCPAGVLTIGYGHTGSGVTRGMRITQAQAEALLAQDLQRFADIVNANVRVRLNRNQIGALVSFTFNVGGGALRSSTLLRRLNAGEDPNRVAREEMPRWNKGGGKVLPGLVRRREAEVRFFSS